MSIKISKDVMLGSQLECWNSYLGSGFDFDRKQVTLPAMKMILTKYNVSPLYLDGGPIPHLGGVGVGVRSKTVFSDTVPNVITGYRKFSDLSSESLTS